MTEMTKAPQPKMPKVERITDVQQLMPMARVMVNREEVSMYDGWLINPGQKVLFINDATSDQLVVEALAEAAREKGAHVTIITLEGFTGLKDSTEMLDNMFSNNWYPDWVWKAANEADLVMLTSFIKAPYTPKPKFSNNPKFANVEITADLMVSAHETYPVELRDFIDEVTWEKLGNCPEIRWTDLEGTDIKMSLTPEEWQKTIDINIQKGGNPYRMHGHLMLPAPSLGISGVFVTSSITFGGPVPRTSLILEKGRVVKVEGGGKFGDRLRESFEQYADLDISAQSVKCPGPGINWLTTIAICTNPKARRSPFFDEMSGSARVYAWTHSHRRSGVMHSSIGEGLVSPTRRIIRHLDTYFGTITTNKGVVVDKGHLTSLDDERVRQFAAKYGDPDKLLTEDWIPAVSGVNVP